VPLAALFQEGTIAHLAALLRRQTDFRSPSPLVAIQPGGTRLPFFCVHPADGTVFSYAQLARYLGQDQPFYGLQVVSQSEEQPPQPHLETMAADYLQATQTIQSQGPYLLGGWSMGGVVAFEMAQQLRRQGQPVALLALLDSWAPSSSNPVNDATEPDSDRQLLAQFLGDLRGRFAKDLPALPDDLAQLDSTEQLNYILEHARLLEFLFPTEELPQLGRLFQTFKANVRAMWGYRPQVYSGRITLFQAGENAFTTDTGTAHQPDPASSWVQFSTEPLELHFVPGDHYAMLAEPHVQTLAKRLRINLDQAQAILKETYHESR
jgi:thioesterase domain-containing protein